MNIQLLNTVESKRKSRFPQTDALPGCATSRHLENNDLLTSQQKFGNRDYKSLANPISISHATFILITYICALIISGLAFYGLWILVHVVGDFLMGFAEWFARSLWPLFWGK